MKELSNKVAVVAGASRGCGRGIALALGSAGATVYVTGRTVRRGFKPPDQASGTIEDTADEVTRRGGRAVALAVDHTDSRAVGSLFQRVVEESGRVDIVACGVWGGNERFLDAAWEKPFWDQPADGWAEFLDAGPRAFWLAAHSACRYMAKQGSGIIVAITEPLLESAPDRMPSTAETFSHLAHYSINRLVSDLAGPAREKGVAVIGLLPGFMKTERVEMHLDSMGEGARKESRYDLAESTEYSGRAVAALAADPDVLEKSGRLLYVADLAGEYDFTDVDGVRVGNFYRLLGLVK